MMHLLTYDFETFYDRQYSLSKLTTEEYIRDPQFEVIGVSVKSNDEPAQWFSGTLKQTRNWLSQFPWDDALAVAHNAMFDAAILNWHFDIRPKGLADTLSMARPVLAGVNAGGSLATLARHFSLGEKGDEVINALGKRRLDFTPEELSRYGRYCLNDTELTYALFLRLAEGFPKDEFKLIDRTLRMFTEPVLELDKGLLKRHLTDVRYKKEQLLSKALISKDNLMSNPQLAETLRTLGVEPPMKVSPTTGKETYAFAKTDEAFKALLEHENPIVQAIVAARIGVKSTLEETRTERFIDIAARGPLPVPLRYYGAHTGRWSGLDQLNLQNLPRKSPLKKALRAPPGFVFVDCDSSQIEARTLAWLAGQWDLVEAFDRGEDVYKTMAASIYGVSVDEVTEQQRFVGKTTILGCFGPDTKVLTNSGWKRIVEVQATDTLWDGEEWVTHEGVVPQGRKEVLTAWGLTATLDHAILTGHGWREWREVLTDPSLFQSAIDKANWKSWAGNSTTNPLGALRDGILGFGVPADGKGVWTDKTLRLDVLLGAMSAPRGRHVEPVKSTGVTKISYLTSNTANGSLIVSQDVSGVATTPEVRHTLTTAVGVSPSMSHGGRTEEPFLRTSYPSEVGITHSWSSTASIILKAMSRAIFGLPADATTCATDGLYAPCRQKLMTYDIAYAGPRNRYTVATDAGPIIVHNCGYGMGPAKFQAQLKTFNVHLPLDECKRIISVYRETYPCIPRLWREVGDALEYLVTGYATEIGEGVRLRVGDGGILLPNGFMLRYPNIRFSLNDKGRQELVYDTHKGKAVIPTRIYGGMAVENICQALARIIIGLQLLTISRRYRVVMTVHDAVGVLVPEAEADEGRAYVEACMRTRPKWALELPLNCESKIGATYGG